MNDRYFQVIIKDEGGTVWETHTIRAESAPHVIHAIDPKARVFVKTYADKQAAQVATELVEGIRNVCNIAMQDAETT